MSTASSSILLGRLTLEGEGATFRQNVREPFTHQHGVPSHKTCNTDDRTSDRTHLGGVYEEVCACGVNVHGIGRGLIEGNRPTFAGSS